MIKLVLREAPQPTQVPLWKLLVKLVLKEHMEEPLQAQEFLQVRQSVVK